MKRALFVLLLVLACFIETRAQSDSSSTKKHRLYVSVDALPILQGIFYRPNFGYYYNNYYPNFYGNYFFSTYNIALFREPVLKVNKTGARDRLGFSFGSNYGEATDTSFSTSQNGYTKFLSLGLILAREKIWQLPYRLKLGFGPTASFNYFKLKYKNPGYETVYDNMTIAGGIGVLGSAYWQAAPWLMLGAESTLMARYTDAKVTYNPNSFSISNTVKSKSYGLNFDPLYRVSVCIRIK